MARMPASPSRATTNAQKRAAAQALVTNGTVGSADLQPRRLQLPAQPGRLPQQQADARAIHDSTDDAAIWGTGSVTGLDNVDMWIGGLAEKQNLMGGLLGSTFEFIFRTQMEALQDGDRLYYLPRIEGTRLQRVAAGQLPRAADPGEHRHQAPARQHLYHAGIHDRGERLLREESRRQRQTGCGRNPTFLQRPTDR